MAVVLFVGLLLLVAACPLPVRRSGALQQHRDQLTRARSLTIPWNAVRRDEERHRNLRLCATLEEIQDDSEPNLFLCTLKSSRNNDVFVQRLHKAVRSKAILDLPYEVRLEVVSEIDFRVNSLTYSSLSECLWCVSQMGLKAEDVAVELANEVARSLTLAGMPSTATIHCVSLSVLTLLQLLVESSE